MAAAAIFRGLKFLLRFICVPDFDSYPSDRELSYDFAKIFVMLLWGLGCVSGNLLLVGLVAEGKYRGALTLGLRAGNFLGVDVWGNHCNWTLCLGGVVMWKGDGLSGRLGEES